MIINLNNNPNIIVKPDYQPIQITGYTPTVITGSGGTTVTNPSPNNFVVYSPSGVLPTVLIGSGNTQTQNVSGNTWIVYSSGGTGGGTWGSITGTLSGQTDLWLELESKLDTSIYQADMAIIAGEIDGNYNILTGHTSDLSLHYKMSGITIGQSQVTGLSAALNSKSGTGHTHSYTGNTILDKPSFVGSGATTVALVGNTYRIYSPTGGSTPVLLPSRALITDMSSGITTSNTTSTEIAYISGLSGNLQSQLNGKSPTNHLHTGVYTPTGTTAQLRTDFNTLSGNTITGGTNLGSGTVIFSGVTANKINAKSLTVSNLTITNNATEINIAAGSIAPKNYWSGTQAAYNALGSYDANTIYFII